MQLQMGPTPRCSSGRLRCCANAATSESMRRTSLNSGKGRQCSSFLPNVAQSVASRLNLLPLTLNQAFRASFSGLLCTGRGQLTHRSSHRYFPHCPHRCRRIIGYKALMRMPSTQKGSKEPMWALVMEYAKVSGLAAASWCQPDQRGRGHLVRLLVLG